MLVKVLPTMTVSSRRSRFISAWRYSSIITGTFMVLAA
jgi:hypothetical protein